MIKLQLLTTVGCSHCAAAKVVLEEIKPDFPNLEIEEVDMTTPEGQELLAKFMIMSSPGVIINDELFAQGGLDKEKLIEKLKSLES